jgi:DNA-binding NarL/FixJ family response regulator
MHSEFPPAQQPGYASLLLTPLLKGHSPAQLNSDSVLPLLIIDSPLGSAFRSLERITAPHPVTLVITFNPCTEYWEDLWDMGATALLVSPKSEAEIAAATHAVSYGNRYRGTPNRRSELNAREREILRCVAQGEGNKSIALQLGLQEKTIMNTLSSIYGKLNVESRTQAALYYWGLWQPPTAQPQIDNSWQYISPPDVEHYPCAILRDAQPNTLRLND